MSKDKSLVEISPEQKLAFRKRKDTDFVDRSVSGIVVYIICWPLLAWLTDFHETQFEFTIWFSAAMWFVAGLRLIHLKWGWRIYDSHYWFWDASLQTLVMAHAVLWSFLYVLMILEPVFEPFTLPLLCVLAGIASASTASLIPKYLLSQVYMSVLILPTVIACQLNPAFDESWPIIFVFWLYQLVVSRRYAREYNQAFVNEAILAENKKQLEIANKTDSLTQLYNRRYFDECLNNQWNTAIRQSSSIALLVIDIDFFKRINDQNGHIVGDHCLIHIAKLLKHSVKRTTDIVARYGGEEFVIILPDTDQEAARAVGENLRKHVEETPYCGHGLSISITVSVGLHVTSPSTNDKTDVIMREADRALYLAKENGRNRVELV